ARRWSPFLQTWDEPVGDWTFSHNFCSHRIEILCQAPGTQGLARRTSASPRAEQNRHAEESHGKPPQHSFRRRCPQSRCRREMIDAMLGNRAAVLSIALTAGLARSRSEQRLKFVVLMGPAPQLMTGPVLKREAPAHLPPERRFQV